MNGAHDMGGTHGFGPVLTEADEPAFHHDWESRAFALALATGSLGKWNLDQSRHARENTPPADYLARSYYEMWLYGTEKLLVEKGVVTAEELAAAQAGEVFEKVAEPPLLAERVDAAMERGGSARVDADVAPLFAVGDRVTALTATTPGHTRAPRYVRGRTGVIDRDHGVFIFADTNSHPTEPDKDPQHTYAVRFEATELWGPDSQGGAVYVDLWDKHLIAATDTTADGQR